MKKWILYIMLIILWGAKAQTGQTSNTGVLYVAPNTLVTVVGDFDNTETGEYENNGEVLFRGHFNNDGITTFDPAYQGYTRFEGFNNQNITGSIPSDFYDVLFRNDNPQPAFRLYTNMGISGNADFFQGVVKNDDFGGIIVFEEGATHTNANNDSYVDGLVQKNGAEAFQYPIGDFGYHRFAAISAPGNPNAVFNAKYYYDNSNFIYPHQNKIGIIEFIDNKEYWTLTKEGESDDVLLTLSWDESTTPQELITDPYEAIHIVRWDEAQRLWVSEGGTVDLESKTVTSWVEVLGYGVFTLARVQIEESIRDVVVYNAVTPNGDGINDYFYIDDVNLFPDNKVVIYNRWGRKLYETTNYDNDGNVFKGYSGADLTIGGELLPTGTYFYTFEYLYNINGQSRKKRKVGFLHLQTN
jgi:gliding motility-associated-like protein